LLAEHFLTRFARQLGRPRPRLTLANIQQLQRYDWPGNVRELQHTLERACIVAADGRLRFDFPATPSKQQSEHSESSTPQRILTDEELRTFEAENIRAACLNVTTRSTDRTEPRHCWE
jgi:DNA-binding NtrC family response regulator